MFLAASSVASRVKPNAALQVDVAEDIGKKQPCTDEEVSSGSCGVRFLDFLIQRQNPKNGLCANVPAPEGGKKKGKRKIHETEARECAADGFLMTMSVEQSIKMHAERTAAGLGQLASVAGSLGAKAAMFGAKAKAAMFAPAGWEQFFQSEELLKLPVPEADGPEAKQFNLLTRQQFEHRVVELQDNKRSAVLSDRDSKLCVFDGTGRIPVELFHPNAQYLDGTPVKRNPKDIYSDEYVHELLSDSDYFYIHETEPIIAFLKIINNAAEAKRLGLPWKADWSSHAYVPLVCSSAKGGGTIAMKKILEFAAGHNIKTIMLSALSHVAWLYHDKAGAKFIDRGGNSIDVGEFAAQKQASEKEARDRGDKVDVNKFDPISEKQFSEKQARMAPSVKSRRVKSNSVKSQGVKSPSVKSNSVRSNP